MLPKATTVRNRQSQANKKRENDPKLSIEGSKVHGSVQ